MKRILLLLFVWLCSAGVLPQCAFAAGPKLSAGEILVHSLIMGVVGGLVYLIILFARGRRKGRIDD